MCGRYEDIARVDEYAARFGPVNGDFAPRVNIAPTEVRPFVVSEGVVTGTFGMKTFIPGPGRNSMFPVFNARTETVREKTTFKKLVDTNRCLVTMTAFYEWRGAKGSKVPFRISGPERFLVAAGLWRQSDKFGPEFAIITTDATDEMEGIHDRMPLFLTPELEGLWRAGDTPPKLVDEILQSVPAVELTLVQAPIWVNKAGVQGELNSA